MFWVCLIGLYLTTFPINDYLLRRVWRAWYPADSELAMMPPSRIATKDMALARTRAVLCFGLVQPAMAALPLLLGSDWYHWGMCAVASAWYAASGSPGFCLNVIGPRHILRTAALLSFFAAGTVIVTVQQV